ncbi:2-pyrone-4,6-dicarboxylate lactonase [Roseivivax marinus]|uniref:amidohydrolase family protein n=1 Tax=Roseivivax marinus TaxID=1379903 RepID=UPI0008D18383|nr:amidohydrolase family protein [Roseivivax marinus]SEL29332.1 2-pyrone-4,6-dicarboxylate lactonase [Roseivivax marinus]
MTERPLTWKPNPRQTRVDLPDGATDCHCHVFGPAEKFPFAPESKLAPADAPKEELFALHDRMGIDRCVIVQSGTHGFDNRAMLDAMAARPGSYLGVALAPPDIPDADLAEFAEAGVRAIRYNYMAHLAPGASDDDLRALAPRLDAHGMHLQIHMESAMIEEMAPVLSEMPIPVVIDHIGRVDASKGREHAHFQALLRLIDRPHVWCKVSGTERASRTEPPYADAVPLTREVAERIPDKIVWGTDWPHPNYRTDPPDDGDLFDLIPEIAPTRELRQAMLVDNPTRLYRFGEGA